MLSECYVDDGCRIHHEETNSNRAWKKRSSRSSKVAQSMWPRARPYVSPDSHPVFCVKKNLQHLSCTHPSHRQRHILRILCPHTQVPNIHNICSQGKGNVCLKAGEKSYPSVPRMSWKPSDGGLKWAYWINIFAVMRFLSTALCPHLGDHFPAGRQHRAKHWRHFCRN